MNTTTPCTTNKTKHPTVYSRLYYAPLPSPLPHYAIEIVMNIVEYVYAKCAATVVDGFLSPRNRRRRRHSPYFVFKS